jgi:acyl-CoA synthetase (AMP-forming)/AMP-acid ligase II
MTETAAKSSSTLAHRLEIGRYAQPPELIEEWHRRGLISGQRLGPSLAEVQRQWPDRLAVVEGDVRLTYGEVARQAGALATALTEAGVGPGDVVSWQLPNWWEAYVLAAATWQIGAVNNPILTIYREHELRQILADLRPKALFAPVTFRRTEHVEMLESVLAEIGHRPALKVAVRDGATGWQDFDVLLGARPTPTTFAGGGPDDPCVVAYTSGTTARAKGVVLGAAALLAETHQMRHSWGMGWGDRVFMPAPLAHLTGVCVGLTVPSLAGGAVVLTERWEPDAALEIIERERCSLSAGTPIFLEEIVSRYEQAGFDGGASLRQFSVGGAAVPPSLVDRADAVGVGAFRCYGMTEHSSVTIANAGLPVATRRDTDGPVAPGTEVSCVDEDGNLLPQGVPGEIRVRGPERMLCYVDARDNASSLTAGEGWFSTGDIGAVDDEGRLTIMGRIKDIINRGGEKFSVREMEDLLATHPDVRHVAVVPAPDERFGETPAAFVVTDAGRTSPTPEQLASFVEGAGLARQKIPTVWRFVDELPRTPFGKVKKQELVRSLGEPA